MYIQHVAFKLMAAKLQTQQNASLVQKRAATRATRRAQQRLECLATLESLTCLHGVPSDELVRLLDRCIFRAFSPGATILSEWGKSALLHLIIHGQVRLTLHDRDGHEVVLGMLGRGDCCGEGPLFGDLFPRAGAFAEQTCYTLQLALSDMQTILPSSPQLAAALRRVYRLRLAEGTLARVPLFSHLSPTERVGLAALLQPTHHPRGSSIINEGEMGEALYLIEAGQAAVEQQGQTIASMDEGDFFGEMALLSEETHTATVRALTPTDVLRLPAAEFHRLLVQRKELEEQLREVAQQRKEQNAALRNNHERAQQVTLVVHHGLRRGNFLLVRQPALCPPACRICEAACAGRFGQPRLHIEGVTLSDREVLAACRQCRVGAECVEACPEHAIIRNDRGALVITAACTGCGACINACPYAAITQVAQFPTAGSLWLLWRSFKQQAQRVIPTIPLEPARPTSRADKCDRCHGYDDLACLSACPTGSLRLVPVEEIVPL